MNKISYDSSSSAQDSENNFNEAHENIDLEHVNVEFENTAPNKGNGNESINDTKDFEATLTFDANRPESRTVTFDERTKGSEILDGSAGARKWAPASNQRLYEMDEFEREMMLLNSAIQEEEQSLAANNNNNNNVNVNVEQQQEQDQEQQGQKKKIFDHQQSHESLQETQGDHKDADSSFQTTITFSSTRHVSVSTPQGSPDSPIEDESSQQSITLTVETLTSKIQRILHTQGLLTARDAEPASKPELSRVQDSLVKKLQLWTRLATTQNVRFNANLLNTHEFRNPHIMAKMLDFMRLDPYGSHLARRVFDADAVGRLPRYNELVSRKPDDLQTRREDLKLKPKKNVEHVKKGKKREGGAFGYTGPRKRI